MKYPHRYFLGLTWMGWLNFGVLQWLCVRLQGSFDDETRVIEAWQIRFALPLTGWWSDYVPGNCYTTLLRRRTG